LAVPGVLSVPVLDTVPDIVEALEWLTFLFEGFLLVLLKFLVDDFVE
jgi:hypothetical protein